MKDGSLRVAIVYRGTVLREHVFTQTSDPTVTVGEDDEHHFVAPEGTLGSATIDVERVDGSYRLRVPEHLSGTVHVDDEEHPLQSFLDEHGTAAGESWTPEGRGTLREIPLGRGDWGRLELGDLEVFVQVTDRPEPIAGRGFESVDRPVLGSVALAGAVHLAFLLACFLAFDVNPELQDRLLADRWAGTIVEDVREPPPDQPDPEPREDTKGEAAPGKEGKFGEEDLEDESEVPEVEGPQKKKVDVEDVGVNEALSTENLGSGPLKNIFGNQDGFSDKMKMAMNGADGELDPGRGTGLGTRGLGSGGGGDGSFGEIQGSLGDAPTGAGASTGAQLDAPEEREVTSTVEEHGPEVGTEFCESQNIKKVVRAKQESIQYCYEKHLQSNPDLGGKLEVQWKIGLDGSVESASIARSGLGHSKVESCILRAVERMRFASPDGGICVVNYPFVFSGGN